MSEAFDPTKPLVTKSYLPSVHGHALHVHTPLRVVDEPSAMGEVNALTAERLWSAGSAVYADRIVATPVETPREEAQRLATIEPTGSHWYLVRVPGFDADKVQGYANAVAKRDALIDSIGDDAPAAVDAPMPPAEDPDADTE